MSTTILGDEKEVQTESGVIDNDSVVTLWKNRFKQADNFKRPIDARNLRMYKIYRAYRAWASNYAYGTNLMPPTGFEIIETVKPRLSSARINVVVMPTKPEDIDSPSLTKWDELIQYDLRVMAFDDLKIDWIDTQLKYGNGVVQLSWDSVKGDPYMELCDNWLMYGDPQAGKRLKGYRWMIKRSWKDKELIQKEEEDRGEDRIYTPEILSGLENQPVKDDPRRDRQSLATLKMGQIDDGTQRDNSSDGSRGEDKQEDSQYKAIEIWECYDFVKQEIVTIGNQEAVLRKDKSDYADINSNRNAGNLFVDLPNISLPWEYHAIPILEPVESTICEIADSRNQAMDNIVYNLDPIRLVKRGRGYKKEDFKSAPGALWFLQQKDDMTIERPPDMSKSWIEKDDILRREIQTSLALSEYTQGIPRSSQEPMGKVELLLMQTNIRFSGLVRQMENAFTDMVNILIELNQKFLTKDKSFRLLGDDFGFKEFTQQDKAVYIDAKVDIIPKKERSPEQESRDVAELYKLFITEDQPDPQNQTAVYKWEKKKAVLQKLILERLDLDEYEDELVDKPTMPTIGATPPPGQNQAGGPPTAATAAPGGAAMAAGGLAQPDITAMQQALPGKEQILPLEGAAVPGATTGMTQPSEGLMKKLANRIRGRK